MKAHVDKDICIGCGLCPSMAPAVFSMEDDGLAVAIQDEVPTEMEEAAEDAVNDCPVSAISVE